MSADLAVLASGSGSNFEALTRAFPGRVGLLLCNVSGAGVLERANRLGVAVEVCEHGSFASRAEHEEALVRRLAEHFSPESLRALLFAGYMRVLTPTFFETFRKSFPGAEILNLHPADPQIYRGARAYRYATEGRFNKWQLCVHRVTAELDGGPVVAMSEQVVYPWEDERALHERLQAAEHELFISVVRSLGS